MAFGSFNILERYALIDLGVRIDLPWQQIADRTKATGKAIDEKGNCEKHAGPHVAVGEISYPGDRKGILVYIKSSLTGDENDYVFDYKKRIRRVSRTRPRSTNCLREEQFEAYRALGFHATHGFFDRRDQFAHRDLSENSCIEGMIEFLDELFPPSSNSDPCWPKKYETFAEWLAADAAEKEKLAKAKTAKASSPADLASAAAKIARAVAAKTPKAKEAVAGLPVTAARPISGRPCPPTAKKTASPPAPRATPVSAPRSAASPRASPAQRLFGVPVDRAGNALALAAALGGLKGPIMKVAQLLATIPDALPPEYANELIKLQSQAPPMGWAFVKRRMRPSSGPTGRSKFKEFEHHPAAAASLGQVHRARALDGARACLQAAISRHAVGGRSRPAAAATCCSRSASASIRRSTPPRSPIEIGARLREELDYVREAKHVALYRAMLKDENAIRVPKVWPELSTGRLLTLDWLDGRKLLEHKDDALAVRNRLATAMFTAWWFPFSRFGVIHGDPHLGNYTVFDDAKGKPAGINLLDYGCIRIFPPSFVGGVVDLYRGLAAQATTTLVVHAYETWGFKRLNRELIDALNIWARFIYGPLLDDRVRTIADGVKPSRIRPQGGLPACTRRCKSQGPVTVPREFVFMDRAAIGLGAVFLHLRAELNFHRLFNEAIENFSVDAGGRAAGRGAGRGRACGERPSPNPVAGKPRRRCPCGRQLR